MSDYALLYIWGSDCIFLWLAYVHVCVGMFPMCFVNFPIPNQFSCFGLCTSYVQVLCLCSIVHVIHNRFWGFVSWRFLIVLFKIFGDFTTNWHLQMYTLLSTYREVIVLINFKFLFCICFKNSILFFLYYVSNKISKSHYLVLSFWI